MAQIRMQAQRFPCNKVELFQMHSFLDEETCIHLIGLINANRRPSTLNDDMGDATYRTSQTCDLAGDEPVVAALNLRLADVLGLNPACGEPLQGQHYAVGQEFKAHTDYFEPGGADFRTHCSITGQRSWTAMIYLNEPEAGGATRFKLLGKIFHPKTGKLLFWNNLLPDGRVNYQTLHQGMKVQRGDKYIITKWFRQRPWA